MEKQQIGCGTVSIPTVLFLIFLVLKLVGVINWSWWWVTSPLWIDFVLLVAMTVITLFVLNKIRKG